MHKALAPLVSVLILVSSCRNNTPQDTRHAVGSAGSAATQAGSGDQQKTDKKILHLHWDASVGTTTEYHIFGLTEDKNSGGDEFASLTVNDVNRAAPSIDIDLANTTLPKIGKLCFYIIAENAGAKSPASNPACINL